MLSAAIRRSTDLHTAQLAWRDQATEARRRLHAALWPSAQAAVAAGLPWLVAHDPLGHAQPFFAPIAAAIALSTSNIRRGRRILQMVVGVTLGIAIGEATSAAMGTSTVAVTAVVLVTMAAALIAGFGIFSEGMMFVNQSAASAILVVALRRHGTGAERLIDALIGGAVAAVIGVGLFPVDPLKVMRQAEREVLRSLAGALGRVADLLASSGRAAPDWTMAAAQDIHVQLAALTTARMTARANVRIAPRRWRLRGTVAIEDGRMSRLDLLANAGLSLFRVAADALEEGEAMPAGLCSSISGLSAVLGTLVTSPQPWSMQMHADVARMVSSIIEAAGEPGAPRAPVVASLVRATARDVLRVLPGADG